MRAERLEDFAELNKEVIMGLRKKLLNLDQYTARLPLRMKGIL